MSHNSPESPGDLLTPRKLPDAPGPRFSAQDQSFLRLCWMLVAVDFHTEAGKRDFCECTGNLIAQCKQRAREQYCERGDFSNNEVATPFQRRYNGKEPVAKFSVIILTCNRPPLLPRSIESTRALERMLK